MGFRMTATDHSVYEELVAPYAIYALGAEEEAMMEEHLALCDICASEVASFHEALAEVAPTTETSGMDALWGRIEREISPPDDSADAAKVVAFEQRRRGSIWLRPSSAVAAIALVISFISTAAAINMNSSKQSLMKSNSAMESQMVANAIASPGSKTLHLTSASNKYSLDIVITKDGKAYITGGVLPPLNGQTSYQVWGIRANGMVSIMVFGSHMKGVAFSLPSNAGFAQIAVTQEPMGGSPAPTSTPIVSSVY